MAQTEDLLQLVNEFPQAFANPEAAPEPMVGNLSAQSGSSITDAKTAQLLQLIAKFPQAFADPEELQVSEPELQVSEPEPPSISSDAALPVTPESASVTATHDAFPHIPAGYVCALRRRVPTLTWGQVDFSLVYGETGLAEIWLTVGKSGTEVQSLGEAICRLINLLLSSGVSIPQIVREIRGIRGADSEGLGPNRILGLADLIGKVLQEAPPEFGMAQIESPARSQTVGSSSANLPEVESPSIPASQSMVSEASATSFGSQANGVGAIRESPLFSDSAIASTLCPECGAELQQANGCKGGACLVCGYSSCS